MTLETAIHQYIIICKDIRKLDKATIKAYKIDFKQFNDFLNCKKNTSFALNDIDKYILSEFIETISRKFAAKSLKRKIASLKAFFNYLEYEEIISVSPFRKIKYSIKEPKRLPKALTIFEIEKLLSALYLHNNSSKYRDIAVFELMFATGIRVSELCTLTMEHVCLDGQYIRILGKGNKERLIYISNQYVLESLKNYITIRPEVSSNYLFINRLGARLSEQSVRFFIEHIGVNVLNKHITPHMIRHSFATLMLDEGVDIRYIQNFLGHNSITTTEIYTHSSTAKQKQIMLNFHPRNRIGSFNEG